MNDKYKEKFSFDNRIYGKIENVVGLFSFTVALGVVYFVIPLFGYDFLWWIDIVLLIIIFTILFSASSSYLGIMSPNSINNEIKKAKERKESPKTAIEIENKEQHKNQKSQQTPKWKLILMGFFIFLFIKVFGSTLLLMVYPETGTSGWMEEEDSLWTRECMQSMAVTSNEHEWWSPQIWRYCNCALKETKKIFPDEPPNPEELKMYIDFIVDQCR